MGAVIDIRTRDVVESPLPICNQEFENYRASFDYGSHCLEILEYSERRKNLVEVILGFADREQLSFFDDKTSTLESILDNMLELKRAGRPLYYRFTRNVNEKNRELAVPKNPLELFFRHYVEMILREAAVHQQCHGWEEGWSPSSSISVHLPIGSVLSFDISSCYKNTRAEYIFGFYYEFFRDKIDDNNIRRDVAGFLTFVSTVYYREGTYALPQGSPISPKLFNRLMYPLDVLLNRCALERGFTYTRWGDDFSVSSRKDCDSRELLGALGIVMGYFPVAKDKVYLQKGSPVFLLGHRIVGNKLGDARNSELKARKTLDLSLDSLEPWANVIGYKDLSDDWF